MTKSNDGDLVCPFCAEDGFDLVGLKIHLQRWCEAFDALDGRTMLERDIAARSKQGGEQ